MSFVHESGLGWAVIFMILLESPMTELPVPHNLPMSILEAKIPLDPHWTGQGHKQRVGLLARGADLIDILMVHQEKNGH
jgi:hypothetical protein